MSEATTSPAGLPLWGARRGPWFLATLHVLFLATPAALTISFGDHPPTQTASIVVISLAIGGLQLRHSLAASRGMGPTGWKWTLPALAALVYLPLWWFAWEAAALEWSTHGPLAAASTALEKGAVSQWSMHGLFVAASTAMLMRGLAARLVIFGTVLLPIPIYAILFWLAEAPTVVTLLINAVYQLTIFTVFPATLYWSSRLVRTIDELFALRAALAESAVVEERRRISRDLHDLLGQSLSAISLKGDLAMRLWPADRDAALAEIDSLTKVAGDALRDVRGVARATPEVSMQTEIDQARALLDAASIETRIDVDLPPLAPPLDHLLAWAVREGTTNMLRHSTARNGWLAAGIQGETVWLEIVNDGAKAPAGHGSGLAGLVERARALSGSLSAEHLRGGRFRLLMEAPAGHSSGLSDHLEILPR